jgi:hypothetical protein
MQPRRFLFKLINIIVALALAAAWGGMQPAPAVQAGQEIPVAALLNSDGTLNTRTGINGALDLRGWDVRLDPARGPVLTRQAAASASPSVETVTALANLGLDRQVDALAVIGSDLFVGGDFTRTNDFAVWNLNYIARYTSGAWYPLANNGLNAAVHALAVSGSDLYVGGVFTQSADGSVKNLNHIACYSGGAWYPLANNGLDIGVAALAVSGSDLYVGGAFTQSADGSVKNLNNIARYSGGAWLSLAHNGLNNGVFALTASGSDLYVGGVFTQSADGSVKNLNNIARYGSGDWSALAHDGLNNGVYALTAIGSDLYIGGGFTQSADGSVTNLNRIARYSSEAWSALANNGLNNVVLALTASGGGLYAGGVFTQSSDGSVTNLNRIARYSSGAWSALANNGLNNVVVALTVSGSNLYGGGGFSQSADGSVTNLNHIARYHLDTPLVYADPLGTCGGYNPCYASLQEAIDKVDLGGEVRYYRGLYNEAVSLDKNASLNFWGGGAVTIGGAFSIGDGVFNAPGSSTLSLAADFTFSAGTFNPNGGTLVFSGSGFQHLDASAPLAFNNLTISPGVTLDENGPGCNATISGTLVNYGTLRRIQAISATGSYTYCLAGGPVNGAVLSTIVTNDGFTSLQLDRSDSQHPHFTGSSEQDGIGWARYWSITPIGSGTLDLTLPANFTTGAGSKVCRYTGIGTTWDCASDATTPNSVTRNGISLTDNGPTADWAAGNVGPTPVTLQTFTVRPDTRIMLGVAFGGLLVLGSAIRLFLLRKRTA